MSSTTDHLALALADVDTQIAALNTQIDQMRSRVDALVDARVRLVEVSATIDDAATVPLSWPTQNPTPKTKPVSKRRKTASSGSKYDLDEVARVAKTAASAGRPMGQAVLDAIDECPSIAMAGFLIKQAREAGHDIPSRRGGVPAARRADPVTDAPAPPHANQGVRNTPFVRPDADTVADLERQAGLT